MVGAYLATLAVDQVVDEITGSESPIDYLEQSFGGSAARTEFETYTPGILVFSVILMVFLAAMTVAHEVEAGTLRWLQLTPLTSVELLGGITLALVLVSIAAVILTFLTALALGFRSQGPVWVAILVGAITSLSIIGVGLIVASFARTVSQAFVIANFPLGLFMFFSGAAFPTPRPVWFTLLGHAVSPYDLLPPTHAVMALNKVLTLGLGFADVLYELTALLLLSLATFALGAALFHYKVLQLSKDKKKGFLSWLKQPPSMIS
jgi:ABC-2 type transport system permease protein